MKPRGLDQRAIKTAIAVCEYALEMTKPADYTLDIVISRVEITRVLNLLKEMDLMA